MPWGLQMGMGMGLGLGWVSRPSGILWRWCTPHHSPRDGLKRFRNRGDFRVNGMQALPLISLRLPIKYGQVEIQVRGNVGGLTLGKKYHTSFKKGNLIKTPFLSTKTHNFKAKKIKTGVENLIGLTSKYTPFKKKV